MSEADHHKIIAEQVDRDRIWGIENFGVNPQGIKEAFKKWLNLLRFADLVRENRPKVLTLVLTQY